ncbi:hypothetical protein ASC95_25820 [Pelomonas sp. Root1217]|uniref:PEP-CTERM sorting domain-containing protein n=1 Tax=Pelomonas sp. Root1217 TaxID=1736430 RepID=UPI00071240A8|nr:PEP-CTERM sorting domain-containing protein [Pelomonas sp. Root1217]KQV46936.1 hypothetical protein ASC95_25820 [Pelomonas sp. Root1217]
MKHFAAALLATSTLTAAASVTYTYMGNPLRDEGNPEEGYIKPGVYASLTLTDDGTELLSWSMGQVNIGELTNSGADKYVRFSLTTDAAGQPIRWSLNAQAQINFHSLSFWTAAHHPWGIPATFDFAAQFYEVQYGNTNAGGVWSSTAPLANLDAQFAVDPLPSVPEPGTMLIFGSGLAAIAWRARRP